MKRHFAIVALTLAAMFLMACGGGSNKEQRQNADKTMEAAQREKDFNKLIVLADSFERDGSLSPAKAYYWRGYASDRMRKLRMAEFYLKTALRRPGGSQNLWAFCHPSC